MSNKYVYEFILLVIGVLVVFFGVHKGYFGDVTQILGDLSFSFLGALKLLPQFQQINFLASTIQAAKQSRYDVEQLHNWIQLNKTSRQLKYGALADNVCITVSSFKFTPRLGTNVKIKSFDIKYNSYTIITGATGVGKTTFLDILLGIREQPTGKITYNNTMKNKNLVYLPQKVFVEDMLVRDFLGIVEDDEDSIEYSTIFPELDWKNFLSANIGENGARVSGGQLQRLSILRVLKTNPNVIFMDEATSAMDTKTEQMIINFLRQKKELALVHITHSKNLLHMADNIINLT